ncbi:DUF5999 family protein [Actinacidiphila rubida]|uniref:Uncharacterized protein n=1 Tax=Actinacidiphila rubida TaxID=310780 RepID=A0A1H8UH83_9ACTN|nr:DUF5999 family protein [Actinacidiphila rubida]SEP02579.1 hypothetical protein SAMN05216267_10739 [Actinacidiphila rubida]
MCRHDPQCPPAEAPDREAARTLFEAPVQGWSLLCNGVISFEDTGEVLPSGEIIPPHRPSAHGARKAAAA